MNVYKFLNQIRGEQIWREFYNLTGINQPTGWKMANRGYSCPPKRIKLLYDLAKKQGRTLSQREVVTLLLGNKLAERLVDLDLILKGRRSLDAWARQAGYTQKAQSKTLGISYSTIFSRRNKRFARFWPRRAVEIARRSNYQIDLFELLGVDRKWFN